MCHLVLLAPVVALPVFWLLPLSIALPAYGGVLGLTALIAWPAVVAMRRPLLTGADGMVGAHGEAITDLNPRGLIRYYAEVWAATADEPIPRRERVRIVAVDGLHVRVARLGRET